MAKAKNEAYWRKWLAKQPVPAENSAPVVPSQPAQKHFNVPGVATVDQDHEQKPFGLRRRKSTTRIPKKGR